MNIENKSMYDKYLSTQFKDRKKKDILIEFNNSYRFFKSYLYKYLNLKDKKNKKVLDIGCGMGHNIYALNKIGFLNIDAVDISQEEIDFIKNNDYLKCNTYCDDIFNFFNQNKKKYNIIVCYDVIEHFNKSEVSIFLDNVSQSLEKDGVFIIVTFNANYPYNLRTRYADFTHEIGFTKESLSSILILKYFEIENIFSVNMFYIWHENFIKYIFRKIFSLSLAMIPEFIHIIMASLQGVIIRECRPILVSISKNNKIIK